MRAAGVVALAFASVTAGCMVDPAVSNSMAANGEVVNPTAPPPEAGSLEAVIVAPGEAEARGYTWQGTLLQFGDQPDGTKLLMDLLARAKEKGAAYVSDVRFHFATSKDGRPVTCEIGIVPEDAPAPIPVPERVEQVRVMTPVSQSVSESHYVCHPVMRPSTRYVTEMQNDCRTESVPVTRYETSYTTQYDYTSKSTRTVSQSRPVTSYESRYTCTPRSVGKTVTEYKTEQDCHMEPVTRTVTRYEFQLQNHFVPPHLEYVQKRRLKESAPVCYVAPGAAPEAGNRLEARLYFPKKGAATR